MDKAVDEYKSERGLPAADADAATPEAAAQASTPAKPAPAAPATPVEAAAPVKAQAAATQESDWQKSLLVTLRQAEPKLSVWLGLLLDGVEGSYNFV